MFGEDLSGLKAGDEVIVMAGAGTAERKLLKTVRAIKPSGRIVTDDGFIFDPDGRLAGGAHGCPAIRPVTPELRMEAEEQVRRQLLGRIDRKLDDLPLDALRRIAAIVDEHAAGREGD
jgi:hypothetical protein